MEFDHLGSLDSCKQVMALQIMARGIEVVACLLNQISVREMYIFLTVQQQTAIGKLNTKSVFEYLCISVSEKGAYTGQGETD